VRSGCCTLLLHALLGCCHLSVNSIAEERGSILTLKRQAILSRQDSGIRTYARLTSRHFAVNKLLTAPGTMPAVRLTVPGMTELLRRYDLTITVDSDGGHLPDLAEFVVAAELAASAHVGAPEATDAPHCG
jgi:hypothetical protein